LFRKSQSKLCKRPQFHTHPVKKVKNIRKDLNDFDKFSSPYKETTSNSNQKSIKVASKLNYKVTGKKSTSFINVDTDGVSTAAGSRLFDRSQSRLDKFQKIMENSNLFGNKSIKKSTGSYATAFSRRKSYQPPLKTYKNPTENSLFNKTMFNGSHKVLLNKTFEWKNIGVMKNVQERMKRRLQFMVSVERSTGRKKKIKKKGHK
jgi:hypothetical protein